MQRNLGQIYTSIKTHNPHQISESLKFSFFQFLIVDFHSHIGQYALKMLDAASGICKTAISDENTLCSRKSPVAYLKECIHFYKNIMSSRIQDHYPTL